MSNDGTTYDQIVTRDKWFHMFTSVEQGKEIVALYKRLQVSTHAHTVSTHAHTVSTHAHTVRTHAQANTPSRRLVGTL